MVLCCCLSYVVLGDMRLRLHSTFELCSFIWTHVTLSAIESIALARQRLHPSTPRSLGMLVEGPTNHHNISSSRLPLSCIVFRCASKVDSFVLPHYSKGIDLRCFPIPLQYGRVRGALPTHRYHGWRASEVPRQLAAPQEPFRKGFPARGPRTRNLTRGGNGCAVLFRNFVIFTVSMFCF